MSKKLNFPGTHTLYAARMLVSDVKKSSQPTRWFADKAGLQPDALSRVIRFSKKEALPERVYNAKGECLNAKECAVFSEGTVAAFAGSIVKDKEPENSHLAEVKGWVWVLLYWLRLDPDELVKEVKAVSEPSRPGQPRTRYETFIDNTEGLD